MCVLPLAPVGILGPLVLLDRTNHMFCGIFQVDDADNKLCTFFWILLLSVPSVSIGTVCYIVYVLIAGAMKVWKPNLAESDSVFMFGMTGEAFWSNAVGFRIAEIVTESCPQSSLGNW